MQYYVILDHLLVALHCTTVQSEKYCSWIESSIKIYNSSDHKYWKVGAKEIIILVCFILVKINLAVDYYCLWFLCIHHNRHQKCYISYKTSSFLSDAKWQHRSVSSLAQVMACCLMAPNHYLNQCHVVINGVLWHLHQTNFTGSAHNVIS